MLPPVHCPPQCDPTKLWVGNVRAGVSKPDVVALFREHDVHGLRDIQVVHRQGADASLILAFCYDWQAQHALRTLRTAGDCNLRSESGRLKVRFKDAAPSR